MTAFFFFFLVFILAWSSSRANQDCQISPPGQPGKRTKSWEQLCGCWMGADQQEETVRRPDVCQRDCGWQEEVLQILQLQTCDHQGDDMCWVREGGHLSGRVCAAGERPVITASAVLEWTDVHFCSLQGDSGGPILCKGALVGVTSFGRDCGTAPGVYAYITKKHLNWIKKTIRTSEMEEWAPALHRSCHRNSKFLFCWWH